MNSYCNKKGRDGADGETRTLTPRAAASKTAASTNFATSASQVLKL